MSNYDEKNRVNYLNGKEWIKKAKNYWFYNSLSKEPYIEDMYNFGYKNRVNGKYELNNPVGQIDSTDFTISKVFNYNLELIESIIRRIRIANYNSYHFVILDSDVIMDKNNKNILLSSLFVSTLTRYNIDYRGKIILHDIDNNVKVALLFLNRLENDNIKIKDFNICIEPDNFYVNASKTKNIMIFNSYSKMDKFALQHPAPYSYQDIEKILDYENINQGRILDPFLGTGSTILSVGNRDLFTTGIELSKEYVDISEQRIKKIANFNINYEIINGDSMKVCNHLEKKYDYVITSPPYHNILKNKGMGIRHDESQKRQGIDYYTESKKDFGNFEYLNEYFDALSRLFGLIKAKLTDKARLYIIISDFTVNKIEEDIHSNIIKIMNENGYKYTGTGYIIQNQKSIYPFGYPYKIVLNHIFQYCMMFEV
ncbi:DNA methyltransferase [Candidatus Izemoplasma sp. B36]|uniref:DNA methyltransferase n=1 Tax=Candidatus Izemoplasma sp. B36 TaxID=3242468 RepID=UPI003559054A